MIKCQVIMAKNDMNTQYQNASDIKLIMDFLVLKSQDCIPIGIYLTSAAWCLFLSIELQLIHYI